MERTIYFADRSLTFVAETSRPEGPVTIPAAGERIDRAKVLKFFENQNTLLLHAPDPDAAFDAFAAGFVRVVAAGGVVVNGRGEWLLIHRNGRWDLPKGHLERGESLAECAVREVGEETGVRGARVVRALCETLHAYSLRGRWELKRTHWFELRTEDALPTEPQREEGIDDVRWCDAAEVRRCLAESFPTIRRVAECMTGH